ncbi:hypothetical protein [Amycolatopsis anabasis]|uniref:hypothetical protein n=1 Tax=Amycolatopsis anabasis TaxID=1840409 RepID=UPI00131D1D3C|nr:hypothetical protein [Amycolatopsis anabasis]
MRRMISRAAIALAFALLGVAPVPAASATAAEPGAAPRVCSYDVPQPLYRRWYDNGRGDGSFGCPTGSAFAYGNGSYQWFENGAMVFSPSQGTNMVTSAFRVGGTGIRFEWGVSDPFNYVDWLVNIRRDGQDIGGDQECDLTQGAGWCGRFSGITSWGNLRPGEYRIVVEGCDLGSGGHTCRQGWTLPVWLTL